MRIKSSYCYLFVFLVIFSILGQILPRLLIGDGLQQYRGEEKIAAQYGYELAEINRDSPLIELMETGVSVVEVSILNDEPSTIQLPTNDTQNFELAKSYEVIVRHHTWFGLPETHYWAYTSTVKDHQ